MSTTQRELLESQSTTAEQHTDNQNSSPKNTQLVEKEHVKGTGFDIVGNEEHGYFVALGKYRLCANQKNKAVCEGMIKRKEWELILGLIGACFQAEQELTQSKLNNNEPTTRTTTEHDQKRNDDISDNTSREA